LRFPDLYPFGEASFTLRVSPSPFDRGVALREKQVGFEKRRPEGASRRVTQHFHSFVRLRFASPNLQFFTKPSVSIGNLFFDADGIGKAAQVQIA
jgi:hypothetical protein